MNNPISTKQYFINPKIKF